MSDQNDNAKGAGKFLDQETWDTLKKSGFSEEELQADQPFGPIVFSYTRAQAIEDGVLVDVTEIARQEGFIIPVAMTGTLYGEVTRCEFLKQMPASMSGNTQEEHAAALAKTMLVGFLRILRREIRRSGGGDRIDFKIGDIDAWALCGPGDEGEAVVTVMLQGED